MTASTIHRLPRVQVLSVRRLALRPLHYMLAFIAPAGEVRVDPEPPISFDWMLGLTLYGALCVALARLLPAPVPAAQPLFWLGLALLFGPPAARIAAPRVASAERLWLLLVLAEGTFALKFLVDPGGFVQFDEFLHWQAASDILENHRLFTPNPNLPVAPLYPGIALVTTALVSLTGFSVFVAGNLALMTFRALFIAALFAFYRRLTGSARLAGTGCLFYMGSSVYVMFDSQLAYESLAVAFMAAVLLAEIELSAPARPVSGLVVTGLLFGALTITHHTTAFFVTASLCAMAIFSCAGRGGKHARPALRAAGVAIGLAGAWLWFTWGAMEAYLGPTLGEAEEQLVSMLQGGEPRREFFHLDSDTIVAPIWLQAMAVGSVLVLALLLAHGFFISVAASARQGRSGWAGLLDVVLGRIGNGRLLFISVLALIWPLTLVLRMTPGGWQLGNRAAAYVFLGVGIVAAFGVARFWRHPGQRTAGLLTCLAASLVAVGGVFSGWGVAAVRSDYAVEGDALSIEPMGIDAANWTRQFLGAGKAFAADRDNRVLLATYGRQRIVPSVFGDAGVAYLYVLPIVSPQLIAEIKQSRLDYLLVDMRMTTDRPYLGSFFENGEPEEIRHAPLEPEPLLKWDAEPLVSRVFDDGFIRIYDVRALRNAP